MTTDLHHKITEAIKMAEFATRRMGPPPSPLGSLNVSDLADALRAVVERHQPVQCTWAGCLTPLTHRLCAACGSGVSHPCDELRVIAEQLGIQEAGRD